MKWLVVVVVAVSGHICLFPADCTCVSDGLGRATCQAQGGVWLPIGACSSPGACWELWHADIDCDGVVAVPDLLILLAWWGLDPGTPPDLNIDGIVNVPDLLLLLGAWGTCGEIQ